MISINGSDPRGVEFADRVMKSQTAVHEAYMWEIGRLKEEIVRLKDKLRIMGAVKFMKGVKHLAEKESD
jgi:hypothetical protein